MMRESCEQSQELDPKSEHPFRDLVERAGSFYRDNGFYPSEVRLGPEAFMLLRRELDDMMKYAVPAIADSQRDPMKALGISLSVVRVEVDVREGLRVTFSGERRPYEPWDTMQRCFPDIENHPAFTGPPAVMQPAGTSEIGAEVERWLADPSWPKC